MLSLFPSRKCSKENVADRRRNALTASKKDASDLARGITEEHIEATKERSPMLSSVDIDERHARQRVLLGIFHGGP